MALQQCVSHSRDYLQRTNQDRPVVILQKHKIWDLGKCVRVSFVLLRFHCQYIHLTLHIGLKVFEELKLCIIVPLLQVENTSTCVCILL